MSRDAQICICAFLMTIWLLVVVPIWYLGMAFAGEVRWLPDLPANTGFWISVAFMYLPPIVSAIIGIRLLKTQKRKTDAEN